MSKAIEKKWVQAVFEDMKKGLTYIEKAAKTIVKKIDEDPKNEEILYNAARDAGVPSKYIHNLIKVGRNMMSIQLILPGGYCKQHNRIVKLQPKKLQDDIMSGKKMPYLASDGTTLMVDLRNCDNWIAKQVFNIEELRTIDQQKSWIESQRGKLSLVEPRNIEDIRINRRKQEIIITGPMKISFKRWLEISAGLMK